MIKLTISHAIAQSVKLALFEGLIENTIESTKHIPQFMAETGKIDMTRYSKSSRKYARMNLTKGVEKQSTKKLGSYSS